jgi:hypothetical protein
VEPFHHTRRSIDLYSFTINKIECICFETAVRHDRSARSVLELYVRSNETFIRTLFNPNGIFILADELKLMI